MKPKVTILTPTYNHKEYIQKCVKSVLNQTYQNWEMIIVDDASRDGTSEIIDGWSKKDVRIKVIHHKKRWGIGKLRQTYNQGLKQAKGKLIAILEGDDFWPENKLKDQIPDFRSSKVVLSYGNSTTVTTEGIPFRIQKYNGGQTYLNNKTAGEILLYFANPDFYLEPVTVMVRKKTLVKIGGFQASKEYPFVDFPTFFRLSLEGNFYYHRQVLGYYRKQPASSWAKFAQKSSSRGRHEVTKALEDFVFKNNEKIGQKLQKEIFSEISAKKEYFSKKEKGRSLSYLLHLYVFGGFNRFKLAGNSIDKKNNLQAVIYAVLLVSFPLRSTFLRLNYAIERTLKYGDNKRGYYNSFLPFFLTKKAKSEKIGVGSL